MDVVVTLHRLHQVGDEAVDTVPVAERGVKSVGGMGLSASGGEENGNQAENSFH